jgi:hypothetical protein
VVPILRTCLIAHEGIREGCYDISFVTILEASYNNFGLEHLDGSCAAIEQAIAREILLSKRRAARLLSALFGNSIGQICK